MGGDCLNYGCVPSKALIKSARVAHQMRQADAYGLEAAEPRFSFRKVMARVHEVIRQVEPHDSVERYTELGVEVLQGYATLINPWTVEVSLADGSRQRLTALSRTDRGWGRFDVQIEGRSRMLPLVARPLRADLTQTPVLCWRWWVDQPVAQADLNTKAGDDYAARIYVTFDLPDSALSLGTRLKLKLARSVHGGELPDAAINYVWDNRHPVGTARANAYTDRAQMLVLRSGTEDSGRWVEERRNLLNDLQQLFAADSAQPLQLAIASDGDNTGAQTGAFFADLHLVAADTACQFPPLLTEATLSKPTAANEH